MIDWHSHILPEMDDGSRSVKESLELLNMLSGQGVSAVALTPHFFPNDESAEKFLQRREISFRKLKSQLKGDEPQTVLGAEVKYYSGISRMQELKKLTIGESGILLLEMPMSKWTEYTVRELVEMSGKGGFTLMLAHIDRYLKFQNSEIWERLYDSEILMQVNASFFNELPTRKKALSMLEAGAINFIGSDCHGLVSRPPKIGKAFEIIRKKLGDSFINDFYEYEKSMLENII